MKSFYPEEKDDAGPIRRLLQNAFLAPGKKPPAVTDEDVRKGNARRDKSSNVNTRDLMRQISND